MMKKTINNGQYRYTPPVLKRIITLINTTLISLPTLSVTKMEKKNQLNSTINYTKSIRRNEETWTENNSRNNFTDWIKDA